MAVAFVVTTTALAGLRCARDCFACPVYLAAAECCGARSFCGWVGENELDVPVALLKTHTQSLRREPVAIACNHNAEPYLSVGTSLPTCSIAATLLENDAAYTGPALKCDFGRRIQPGNASVAACDETIRAWAASFGVTAEPTPEPTPAPTRSPSLVPTPGTFEPTESLPPRTSTSTLPASVSATAITEPAETGTDTTRQVGALTWVMLAALIVCILLNVGFAIMLASKRVAPLPNEPEPEDEDWEMPSSFSNPSYEPPRDAVYNDTMPQAPVYEVPSEIGNEQSGAIYDPATGVIYDPATLDSSSTNSAC